VFTARHSQARGVGKSEESLLTETPHCSDHFKIMISMEKKHIVLQRDLGDATVNRTSYGLTDPA